jgi:hypothetical protein
LWAHHQVLSQEADAGTAESITEIRKLGYSYGLVTSQTALLVSSASLMACLDRPTSTSDHLTLVENAALDLPPAEARALRPVLAQNVPNPFNAETEIRFSIPVGVSAVAAELDLLNLAGQRLRSWSFEGLTPGDQAVVWDGRDNDGRPAASGVYLCRLQVGGHSICRRLALLR